MRSTEESNLNPFESNRFPGGLPSTQKSCSVQLGRGEIRTHEPLAGLPVFKTGALSHSATLPTSSTYLLRAQSASKKQKQATASRHLAFPFAT